MTKRYLDSTGLAYFWSKIKSVFVKKEDVGNTKSFYGTCATAAATVVKEVTCPDFISTDLVDGVTVLVKFSITNTGSVASLKLNVNQTGEYPIKKIYNSSISNLTAVDELRADAVIQFVFTGTYWMVTGYDYNTTYEAGNGIDISSSNYISVKIDGTNANGLGVGSSGLSLGVVTPSVSGVGGTNGAMTAADKEKLDGISAGAGVQVQSDWNQSDTTAPDYIKNKISPSSTAPAMDGTAAAGTSTDYARKDHVHPTNTNLVAKSSQSIANDTAHTSTYDTTQGKKITIGVSSGTANVDVVPHSLVTGEITETVNTDKQRIPTAAAAQIYSKKLQNQILSRGENLVINCNGYMGDNTNFTSTTFTAEVCNGSYGSFYKAGKTPISSSYNIPINPSYKYRVGADVKRSLNVSVSDFYVFLGFKDVDNNAIMQGHVLYMNGTETELTQDLVDGDTVVHVSDLSGWNTTSGQYNIMFFNWTNTKGYTYPPYTYTRRYKGYGSNDNIDFENNTITLSSAYTGETIPSGTKIAKQRGGVGTYFYAKTSSTSTDWKRVEGYYNAYKQNDESCIPFATAKASMNFLVGYGNSSTSEGTWITNIEVTALASIKDLDAKLDVESPMLYDGKEIVQDLDSKYALRNAYIDYRGIWQGSSTYKHYAISVVGIRKVEITPQQDSVIFYSFLKNYVSGNVPSCQYAYGYTSRCQSDGKIQLLVPYDADKLYIYVGAASTKPYKPASLKLTGIAITRTEDEGEYLNCNPTTADETFVSNWRHHDVTSMILSSPYSYIRKGYIRTSDSKYVDSTVNKSSWIIVSENISKIHVKTSSSVTYIAFLSKEGVSNTVLPFYVENTSLITVQADSETTYNVPSGTAYIYIYLGSLTNNVYSNIPQSLYFTGDKGVDMFPLTIGDVSYDGSEPVSLTGIALDGDVVHKAGSETITGVKTFDNVVCVNSGNSIEFNAGTGQNQVDLYIGNAVGGHAVFNIEDTDGGIGTIVRGVAAPVADDDAVNKAYADDLKVVYLNGRSSTYGIHPWSLCAFSFEASGLNPTQMFMTSFTNTSGYGGGAPINGLLFPVGCKIYYHPDTSYFNPSTDFESKKFLSSHKDVDARYSSITGVSLNLGDSTYSTVYLRVEVDSSGKYWKPYYRAGESYENIVSSDDLIANNYYIYLGKTVGSTGYKFQLEDNNPLYYYDGNDFIDWANYICSNSGSSDYTGLDNKPSINGVTLVGNKTAETLGLALMSQGVASITSQQDGTIVFTFADGETTTVDLNHTHPNYYKKVAETSQPSGGFLPDVVYELGNITGSVTFSLASAVSGNVNHYFWTFNTASMGASVTWPSNITWYDGSAPTIDASTHYEISILNGIAMAMKKGLPTPS